MPAGPDEKAEAVNEGSTKEEAEEGEESESSEEQPLIGPLTHKQRQDKVIKFITKKRIKSNCKKFTYECRKHVSEKRLRIKGRFVTKNQAFEILGLHEDDENSNENL